MLRKCAQLGIMDFQTVASALSISRFAHGTETSDLVRREMSSVSVLPITEPGAPSAVQPHPDGLGASQDHPVTWPFLSSMVASG